MAYLTEEQLKRLFYQTTVAMTGLPVDKVRHAYAPQGQPSFTQDETVVFLYLTETDNPINRQRDIIYLKNDATSAIQSTFYTRVMQCAWTVYGPTAYDVAENIRYQILTPDIRATLASSDVFPVPDISAPIKAPELRSANWWQRADLTVQFNVGTLRNTTIPVLAGAYIKVVTKEGIQRTIQVPLPSDVLAPTTAYLLNQDGTITLFEDGSKQALENGLP